MSVKDEVLNYIDEVLEEMTYGKGHSSEETDVIISKFDKMKVFVRELSDES